ncbi:DUF4433 domain-containing protein [Kribbella antibiotica]|uniref:DUF4433 domain-containing protein n=1 Tax=Kribbella antibiotica TaxID=190195 RepID=A0A4R4ZI75_9ACTN|nr:DarT ssDNA thymidine ADP-ribosyltransferase family protein [Kribbella antibiotica]TDD57414.1 DUF4433 domain-containing protein [Kribbella antibiotica]
MNSQPIPGATIDDLILHYGFTRLAHFTPSMNLPHIIGDGMIRSSKDLAEQSPDHFSPTDRERFDRNPDKVCCTIQYPNPYYLSDARGKREFINYPDWVCFFLNVTLLTRQGTLFAPVNAATQRGSLLRQGPDALAAMYAPDASRHGRGARHRAEVPTDLQAEVQVPGPIALSEVRGVAVPSEEAAITESARLRLLGHNPSILRWTVAPMLFDRNGLVTRLRNGGAIIDQPWHPTP